MRNTSTFRRCELLIHSTAIKTNVCAEPFCVTFGFSIQFPPFRRSQHFGEPRNCITFACGLLLLSSLCTMCVLRATALSPFVKVLQSRTIAAISTNSQVFFLFVSPVFEIRNWIVFWLSGRVRMWACVCARSSEKAKVRCVLFHLKKKCSCACACAGACVCVNPFLKSRLYTFANFVLSGVIPSLSSHRNLLCVVYTGFHVLMCFHK